MWRNEQKEKKKKSQGLGNLISSNFSFLNDDDNPLFVALYTFSDLGFQPLESLSPSLDSLVRFCPLREFISLVR